MTRFRVFVNANIRTRAIEKKHPSSGHGGDVIFFYVTNMYFSYIS